MIQFKHVSYTACKQKILKDLNFTIATGERVALIGPSGAGKTTLLQLLNGVGQFFENQAISGEVVLDQRSMRRISANEISQLVGNVFQDPRNQFFAKNVADELYLRLGNYPLTAAQVTQYYREAVAQFHLAPLLKSRLSDLSSGQKQTVAFALASVPHPKVLLLDEPSANLDLPEIHHMTEQLQQLSQQTTLVVAEHHLFYLMGVIDRFIYLDHGEIQGEYTRRQLQAMPLQQRIKLGLRSPNLIPEQLLPKLSYQQSQELIRVADLRFGYRWRQPLLGPVNLTINQASSWGIIGRNGIGKSTLAKLLSGLLRPQHGKCYLYQQRVLRHQLRHVSWYVMQQTTYQLFTDSVWHELFLNLAETPARIQEAHQLLAELGLIAYCDRHPATLSGGQKQRLVLATALLHNPELVLLDEPSSGLDQRNLLRVIACLKRYQQQFGLTLVIISHDPEFLYQTCDYYLVLKHTAAAEVVAQPATYHDFISYFR